MGPLAAAGRGHPRPCRDRDWFGPAVASRRGAGDSGAVAEKILGESALKKCLSAYSPNRQRRCDSTCSQPVSQKRQAAKASSVSRSGMAGPGDSASTSEQAIFERGSAAPRSEGLLRETGGPGLGQAAWPAAGGERAADPAPARCCGPARRGNVFCLSLPSDSASPLRINQGHQQAGGQAVGPLNAGPIAVAAVGPPQSAAPSQSGTSSAGQQPQASPARTSLAPSGPCPLGAPVRPAASNERRNSRPMPSQWRR